MSRPSQSIPVASRGQRGRSLRLRRAAVLLSLPAFLALLVPLVACGVDKAAALPVVSVRAVGVAADLAREALPRPTRSKPLRIYFGGDSIAGIPCIQFAKRAAATRVMKTFADWLVSSRLCNNTPVNWMARLRAKVVALHPGAVVFMVGANDAGMPILAKGHLYGFWEKGWFKEYRRRVGVMMDDALRNGAKRFYWVGMPIMPPGKYPSSAQMKRLNGAFRLEAEERAAQVRYVNIWGTLATKDGRYDRQWRAGDGVHITYAGADRVAAKIMAAVKRDWLPPL